MKRYILIILAALALYSCDCGVKVTLLNEIESAREEMAELPWSDIESRLNLKEGESFIVVDNNGMEIPYQLPTYGKATPQKLIFPVSLDANESATFTVKRGTPQNYESKVLARFVPERKDDFSWENDKVAFRMYGPALEVDPVEKLISGGMDIWVKSTSKLVTEQWYKDDIGGVRTYHADHGEGLDYYSVGRSLGAGTAAPYSNDSLYYISHNFKSYEILDNGPLRAVFRFTYAPYYGADSVVINETRTIEFDAGSHANKITEHYANLDRDIEIAAGFPYYNNDNYITSDEEGYIAYALPANPKNGTTYLGVIYDGGFKENRVCQKQLVGVMDYSKELSVKGGLTYYTAGGWSKGGFDSEQQWQNYVKDLSKRIKSPLKVEIK